MLANNFVWLPFENAVLRRDPPLAPQASVPVILVHGYLSNRGTLCRLARALDEAGAGPVFVPSLPAVLAPIETFATHLERVVREVTEATGQGRAILVCHSMGGLIARTYLREPRRRTGRGDRHAGKPAPWQRARGAGLRRERPPDASGQRVPARLSRKPRLRRSRPFPRCPSTPSTTTWSPRRTPAASPGRATCESRAWGTSPCCWTGACTAPWPRRSRAFAPAAAA